MPTRNVKLTEHHDRFVHEQISLGKFQSASEVMQAGLRLLEQQTREEQEKLALLRALASDAFDQLDQGQGIAIESRSELAQRIGRIGRRAARRANRYSNGD